MRMIYKIVLGLLLFNAFLALYGPLFNTSLSDDAVDYESSGMQQYKLDSVGDIMGIIFSAGNFGAWGASAVVLAAGMVGAFVTKNYIYIGVALFVAIVIGLYIKMSATIANIGNVTDNIYVTGIIAIVGIAIGLMVVFNVIDMFAPASARE